MPIRYFVIFWSLLTRLLHPLLGRDFSHGQRCACTQCPSSSESTGCGGSSSNTQITCGTQSEFVRGQESTQCSCAASALVFGNVHWECCELRQTGYLIAAQTRNISQHDMFLVSRIVHSCGMPCSRGDVLHCVMFVQVIAYLMSWIVPVSRGHRS